MEGHWNILHMNHQVRKSYFWAHSFLTSAQNQDQNISRKTVLAVSRKWPSNPQSALPKLWLKGSPMVRERPSVFLSPRVSRAAGSSRVCALEQCLDRIDSRLLWKQWDLTGPSKASRRIKGRKRDLDFLSIYRQSDDYRVSDPTPTLPIARPLHFAPRRVGCPLSRIFQEYL